MARKEEWITSAEARAILSTNSGHEISDAHVRRLAKLGKITTKPLDGRTKLYLKSDTEAYKVRKRGDGSVRCEARRPRSEA